MNKEYEILKDKYERLLENQQNLQDTNSKLENKILEYVNNITISQEKYEKQIEILSQQVFNLSQLISDMEKENERYKRDCSIAVNLLQCKPNEYALRQDSTLYPNHKSSQYKTPDSKLFITSPFLPVAAAYMPSYNEESNKAVQISTQQSNEQNIDITTPQNGLDICNKCSGCFYNNTFDASKTDV